jgi:ribonuclease HI
VEYSLKFEFPTSNNQAEYEACLAGIRVAKELGATAITLCSDSQLVVSQIKGEYQAREPLLQRYLAKVKESLLGLSKFEI